MMKILHASQRFASDISICSAIIFTLAELVTKGHLRPLKRGQRMETLLNVSFRSTEHQPPGTPLSVTTPVAGLFACSVGCWMFIPVAFTPGFSSRIHNAIRQT